jgi:Ankyrin repeats (3 copies)/SMI1-KNR4 cell-wall
MVPEVYQVFITQFTGCRMSQKELYQAVASQDWKVIGNLLRQHPNLLTQTFIMQSLLNYAVKQSRLDQVQHLVSCGLSVNFCEGCEPPIATAIQTRSLDILKWLLENGADVNVSPRTKPLIYSAIHSESLEIVSLLVEYGADLNCSWGIWESPLANAAAGKNNEIFEFLKSRSIVSKKDIEHYDVEHYVKPFKSQSKLLRIDALGLEKVENELGCAIPPVYRAFLSSLPDDLLTHDDVGIYHSADVIIKSTKAARAYKEEDWAEPYSDNLIAVGWNGCGSVYCVRGGENGDNVYLFEHERGEINHDETLTLDEFLAVARSWSKNKEIRSGER